APEGVEHRGVDLGRDRGAAHDDGDARRHIRPSVDAAAGMALADERLHTVSAFEDRPRDLAHVFAPAGAGARGGAWASGRRGTAGWAPSASRSATASRRIRSRTAANSFASVVSMGAATSMSIDCSPKPAMRT